MERSFVIEEGGERLNTMAQVLFTTMKETLAIMTAADPADTIGYIDELLAGLIHDWNREVCLHLCWSVGAITRTLPFTEERDFLERFTRALFNICDELGPGEEQAFLASGLMYVCAQYPRCLMNDPALLDDVMKRLFEFMQAPIEGVRVMAVHSFKSIAETNCKRTLRGSNFLNSFLDNLGYTLTQLDRSQAVEFIGAIATIIEAIAAPRLKQEKLDRLLREINMVWEAATAVMPSVEAAIELLYLLHCNAAVAESLSGAYRSQLCWIYDSLMDTYRAYSDFCSARVEFLGPMAARHEEVKFGRQVKSGVLQILRNYITKTPRVAEDAESILPRILTDVVTEYGTSPPEARVSEVLDLLEILCTKMEEPIAMALPLVFDGVFYPTVDMLRDDFEQFVTFRVPMFNFMRILVEKYPSNLLSGPPEHFDALMSFIWWGCEHPTADVCFVALQTIELMFRKVLESDASPDIHTAFLAAYYLPTVTKVFQIMQDTHHKFAFDEEAKLLSTLLKIQAQQAHSDFITE
jgi:exportin-1